MSRRRVPLNALQEASVRSRGSVAGRLRRAKVRKVRVSPTQTIAAEASDPPYEPLSRHYHEAESLLPENAIEPADIFELFWSEEVMESLVANTNAYAELKMADQNEYRRKWKPTNSKELYVFLGILIALGIFKCKTPSDV